MNRQHRLFVERLEERNLLAASGPGSGDPTGELARIDAVLLKLNGQEMRVEDSEEIVLVRPGDQLEVTGFYLELGAEASQAEGVLAIEGYLRKPSNMDLLGGFDYEDGRFGGGLAFEALSELPFHPGLGGEWILARSWNRLSMPLVHYFGDEWETIDRFFINLQYDLPDFSADFTNTENHGQLTAKVGQEVRFKGTIANKGQGTASTYIEVDVYHESDPLTPVWVGTLSGTVKGGGRFEGRIANHNPNDAFDVYWRPSKVGKYTIKVYADPEHLWKESDEDNNVLARTFTVWATDDHDGDGTSDRDE